MLYAALAMVVLRPRAGEKFSSVELRGAEYSMGMRLNEFYNGANFCRKTISEVEFSQF